VPLAVRAIDAMLTLVRENDLTPGMVAKIESRTHPRRFAHTNRPDPRGALDAKFSVQYCVARALVSRAVLIEHFEDGSYDEPEVRSVLNMIWGYLRDDTGISSRVSLSRSFLREVACLAWEALEEKR